ncbi:MAG: dihydropteroate synthase [Bacteroidales bacterium]
MENYTINIKRRLVELTQPLVMGIMNITPDSFYSGSRTSTEHTIIQRTHQILSEGADIIDVGAYSSRPFADDIPMEQEWERLAFALNIIRSEAPDVIISVDTFRAEIAKRAVEQYGVDIINDISMGDLDSDMFSTIAELQVPYILMHMRGDMHTMTSLTDYDNLVADIIKSLAIKVSELVSLGVADIIIDPGFGFSKTVEQNYELLKSLREFEILQRPLLVGISRKSMIYKPLEITPSEALNGTTVLNTLAVMNGAKILRVHDVREAVEVVKLIELTNN